MSLYDNIKCPVCGETFHDGDDVVTCPECGTPHHRECYKKLGKCVNTSLHNTDYLFNRESESNASTPKTEANNADVFYSPDKVGEETESLKTCPVCNEKIPTDASTCPNCGARQQNAASGQFTFPFATNQNNGANSEIENSSDKIDGVKLKDAAIVLGVNPLKYLIKFKKNRKINWNWSAFIFGPYYFFFRKLYLPGTIALAIQIACRLIVYTFFSKELTSVMNSFEKVFNIKDASQQLDAMTKLSQTAEYGKAMLASVIIMSAIAVIHFVSALIADSIYRKKVINIVKTVDEKLENNEAFSLAGSLMEMYDHDMSTDEIRNQLIARQGGVSVFAPLIALLAVNIISGFLP